MSKQTTENLIAGLSAEFKPMRPLAHPLTRITPWFGATLLYVTALSVLLGMRADAQSLLQTSSFLFEALMVLLMAVGAALATGWLAVPDMRGQGWLLAVPTTLFALFMGWLAVQALSTPLHADFHVHGCSLNALLLIAPPFAAFVYTARKGATVRPLWMSFMTLLAVAGPGWIALRLACPVDHITHLFLHHFLPYAGVGALTGMLARRLYRW
ncbi:MAG: DUF1109 domain-containing protein [Rhodospirillales bacterium]|nr:DUF1109 domain-containing protein [Rhodospirillales bacterium]